MAARAITRLNPKTSALLLCDMQEKFRTTVQYFLPIVSVSKRMLEVARLLEVPALATEQYTKGLGFTVPELGLKEHGVPVFDKTCFSMMVEQVHDYLKRSMPAAKQIVLCGIEAHVCIFQTTLDLLDHGYDVHLVVDAISARTQVDRFFGMRQMERFGAHLTTSECVMFAWMRDSAHPKFKEVQKLIMTPAADSGLLSSGIQK